MTADPLKISNLHILFLLIQLKRKRINAQQNIFYIWSNSIIITSANKNILPDGNSPPRYILCLMCNLLFIFSFETENSFIQKIRNYSFLQWNVYIRIHPRKFEQIAGFISMLLFAMLIMSISHYF